MTNPVFNILPFAITAKKPPLVPATDISRLNGVEVGAYEHWVFGTGSGSLTGLLNARALTPQGSAPSYSSNYLTISTANGQSLQSTLAAPVANSRTTLAMVARASSWGSAAVLAGNLGSSNGGGLFTDTGPTLAQNHRGLTTTQNTSKTLATNSWLFIAIARDFLSTTKRITVLVGGQTAFANTPTGTYTPGTALIALGNNALGSGGTISLDVAEFLIYESALTATELSNLYTRSKARLALRGLTVV